MLVGQVEAKVRLIPQHWLCLPLFSFSVSQLSLFLFLSRLFGQFLSSLVYFFFFLSLFSTSSWNLLTPVNSLSLCILYPPPFFPSPLPPCSLVPKACVGACGSMPALLVRTWTLFSLFLFLSLCQSGWGDAAYSIRSYILCTTPLSLTVSDQLLTFLFSYLLTLSLCSLYFLLNNKYSVSLLFLSESLILTFDILTSFISLLFSLLI